MISHSLSGIFYVKPTIYIFRVEQGIPFEILKISLLLLLRIIDRIMNFFLLHIDGVGGMFVSERYWGIKPLVYSIRFHRKQLEKSKKNHFEQEGFQELCRLERQLYKIENELKTRPFDLLMGYYFQDRLARFGQKLLHWQEKYEQAPLLQTQNVEKDDQKAEPEPLEISRVPIGKHRLPPLPYSYDALEPYIDEQTMRLHHDQHHQSYVDHLNQAERAMEKARQTNNYQLLKHWEREAAFHGAGHYLHTLFWNVMNPKGGGKPSGELMQQIQQDFGSFGRFQKHFSEAANQVEGGGWAILVWSPRAHRLEILQAEKHQNLTQWDVIPLLPLDVWEHAYYLKYKNKRKDYIRSWWNLVYWPEVEKRFAVAQKVRWKPY